MDLQALYKISHGLYVIGSEQDQRFTGAVVDKVFQLTMHPPTLAVSAVNLNETTSAIKESGKLTISVLNQQVDPFVIGNFGFQSGGDKDKWINVPHAKYHGLPVLEHAAAYYYCKVKESIPLSTHTLFICSVEDACDGEGEPLLFDYYQKHMKDEVGEAFKQYKEGKLHISTYATMMAKNLGATAAGQGAWVCSICDYIYKGTEPFEDLPPDWICPLCHHSKALFCLTNLY